jgi:hypothetical protein
MRFHNGPVPENPDFHPETEGWQDIHEPSSIALQLIGIPVVFSLLVLWAVFILLLVLPHPLSIKLPKDAEFIKLCLWLAILVIPMIPLHLFLQTLAHPKWGLSSNSIIGYWPARGWFYSHYDGALSRNRFITVFLTPVVATCVIPMLLIFIFPTWLNALLLFSFWGVVMSTTNIVITCLIVYQIPPFTIVRNKGLKTYWKFIA